MDERLQRFAELVESGSFTAAARELHISQPALTMAINKLERELKAPLLLRGRGGLRLTPAGQLVYAAAVEHRTADENLRAKLTELTGQRPKVAIGMIDSVAAALNASPEALNKLEDRADVSITVNNSRYLRDAVDNREIDLAFVVRGDASPHLEAKSVGAEPFVLVCRPDRLEFFQNALKTGHLPDFVCYDQNSTTYGHLRRGLGDLGVTIKPALHSTNPDIMLNTVLRGRGIAALPYLLTQDPLESGKLAALKHGRRVLMIDCPLDAVKLRGRLLPAALSDFLSSTEAILRGKA
jgi:DNA-binding transcriptional LysR family regulator